MTADIVARLHKRAREWGAKVDGWLKQAEDMGQEVAPETERVMRDTIYREAADEIERLRGGITDALKCTPSIKWYGHDHAEIVYDCGNPWAILCALIKEHEHEG